MAPLHRAIFGRVPNDSDCVVELLATVRPMAEPFRPRVERSRQRRCSLAQQLPGRHAWHDDVDLTIRRFAGWPVREPHRVAL